MTGQLWGITTTTLQVRIKLQLNTILFQKTLVRKDIASSNPDTPKAAPGADAAAAASGDDSPAQKDEPKKKDGEDEDGAGGQQPPYFARAIHQSGSVTARTFPNATYPLYAEHFATLMDHIGCPTDVDNAAAL